VVSEIMAGLSALNSAFGMAKALKDINDTAVRNAAVIDLQGQILTAQEAQAALVERVRQLEEEVANFKTWEAEKQRYEMKTLGSGVFVYMLKPETRGAEPPHWVCANCYGNQKASILQSTGEMTVGRPSFRCPSCKTTVVLSRNLATPQWI
jgi:rubrerythrin